jgi:hypothetical protein
MKKEESAPESTTGEAKTEAQKIWDEIQNVDLHMFTLSNQFVNTFCNPVFVEPNRLYMTFSVSSVLPALENALGTKFNFELNYKYIVVSRITNKF